MPRALPRRRAVSARWRALFFFDGHCVAVEATPDRARRETHAVRRRQPVRQFYERNIALSLDLGQQEVRPGLNPMRTTIAALRQRMVAVARAPFRHPPDHARRRNTKTSRRRTAAHPGCHGGKCALAKVGRQGSGHARRPPVRQEA